MSTRRLVDMVSAAVLMIGLGYVVAVSAHSLPGEDGEDALVDAGFAFPPALIELFQWAVLAAAAGGALFCILSVARAARREKFDFKRFRVLIYWLIAFYLALQIRPPEAPQAGGGAPAIPLPPGDEPIPPGEVIEAGWVAGILVVAVVAAIVARFFLSRRRELPVVEDAQVPASTLSPGLARPLATTEAKDPRGRILNAYAHFERGTMEAGYGRQVSETPRGHARRAGRELDLESEALAVLEGEYEAVRFGDRPVGSSDAEAAESAWARLRGRLGL